MNYAKEIITPQSEQADDLQIKNNNDGYSFQANKWQRLRRFLILGTEGGSFYVRQGKLTRENAKNVLDCISEDYLKTIYTVREISEGGKAKSNDPAIFVLSLLLIDKKAKQAASINVNSICRIGTHLFTLVDYLNTQRGFGRLIRNTISMWYNQKAEWVAFQVMKYANRNGWTHRDVLRKAHIKPKTDEHNLLFKGITKDNYEGIGGFIAACQEAKECSDKKLINLIQEFNLPWEVLPTEKLRSSKIWEAMLPKMPLGALTRNLGRLGSIELLIDTNFDIINMIESKFTEEAIKKSRLHPLSILNALYVYSSGHGVKGNLEWRVVPRIKDILDNAFYASFENVEPTNKRIMLALDVSASMTFDKIAGTQLTPRDATAALALVTARAEKNYCIMGFTSGFIELDISPEMRLNDAINAIDDLPHGGTDCAVPILYAQQQKAGVDAFVIYTDSETWAGNIHPHAALSDYRRQSGLNSSLIVCGMVSNEFTIADPRDPRQLDIVGFSTDCPALINEFISEKI